MESVLHIAKSTLKERSSELSSNQALFLYTHHTEPTPVVGERDKSPSVVAAFASPYTVEEHIMFSSNGIRVVALSAAAVATAPSLAQDLMITQGTTMYRYQSGVVSTFANIGDVISGMTNVPNGMTVGTLNGGASNGDILAVGRNGVYRVDNPMGTPSLTLIGARGGPNASPVFVGGRLFGVAGVLPQGSTVVEWNPTTFAQVGQWATGIFGGPGGVVAVPGTTDEFYYSEFNNDLIYHYRLGDTFSTPVCTTPNNDYVGLEMISGTIYASYALPATQQFVLGTQALDGTFTQLAMLDTYNEGITGLAQIIPSPGTLGLFAGAVLVSTRRRRRSKCRGQPSFLGYLNQSVINVREVGWVANAS